MDKNRIIAYSLLAHINDNEVGIRDLTDIFKPLVKRALSKLTVEGRLEGKIEDVKEKFDSLYSLDIPFPYLEQLLKRLASEFERDSGIEFRIFQDGSYTSSRFVFTEYEDFLAQQETEIDAVQSEFEKFAAALGQTYEDTPSI